jgi:predicted membrane channel-forming protein YqfA (hemolysin III family)
MTTGLTLVVLALAAFFAAHFAFDRLARRFLIVSGAEYLALGIILGPQVFGILSPRMLESLAPFPLLALGWMGAIVGMRFYLRDLVRIPAVTYQVALLESVLTFLIVGGALLLAFSEAYDTSYAVAAPAAITLGAIAVSSSRDTYHVLSAHLGTTNPLMRQLDVSAAINSLIAAGIFAWVLSAYHPIPPGAARPLTTTEWMVITIAIGAIGGMLFHLFLGAEAHLDRLFVALSGAVILVSGATAYLQLSPLFAGAAFGFILVNTSRRREEIAAALLRVERPLYFVLLIFAGAMWQPSLRAWVLPVGLFLIARAIAKVGGARLSGRMMGLLPALGPNWGRALLGHGGVAIALGVDYVQQQALPFTTTVFTAVIASVLLTDLTSARIGRAVAQTTPEQGTN